MQCRLSYESGNSRQLCRLGKRHCAAPWSDSNACHPSTEKTAGPWLELAATGCCVLVRFRQRPDVDR